MSRDKEILEKVYNEQASSNFNIVTEYNPVSAESIALAAQKKTAIAFDKWKANEGVEVAFFDNDEPIYYYKQENYTGEQLYEIWNKTNNQ